MVVTVGGYASVPAGLAAILARVPLITVSTDAVPGAANRLLGRFAVANAVAFDETSLPRAHVTGTPVRPELVSLDRSPEGRARARTRLGLPPHRQTIAAVSGSLGARRVNRAVAELAGGWPGGEERSLYQVTGRRDFDTFAAGSGPDPVTGRTLGDADGEDSVRENREGEGSGDGHGRGGGDGEDKGKACGRCGLSAAEGPGGEGEPPCHRVVPYEEHMDDLYAAADVCIARAGAMTVAELLVSGVPSILVPLPGAPGDHQTCNAEALARFGAAVVVPDGECDGRRLGCELDALFADPQRLRAMSDAALQHRHPEAAQRVAELIDAHAR
jgi:UDP-N-acetylglucosamine--N-acetylmuramyl-(pentapeptide) pyrophosphoryl-undecaprenol N-acetylglucosamine transferase